MVWKDTRIYHDGQFGRLPPLCGSCCANAVLPFVRLHQDAHATSTGPAQDDARCSIQAALLQKVGHDCLQHCLPPKVQPSAAKPSRHVRGLRFRDVPGVGATITVAHEYMRPAHPGPSWRPGSLRSPAASRHGSGSSSLGARPGAWSPLCAHTSPLPHGGSATCQARIQRICSTAAGSHPGNVLHAQPPPPAARHPQRLRLLPRSRGAPRRADTLPLLPPRALGPDMRSESSRPAPASRGSPWVPRPPTRRTYVDSSLGRSVLGEKGDRWGAMCK
mmetsp:Transcript_37699/g.96439  ORF Transcript_37699/g.96439 Transcript_37699/m.96439 type:complete len:275 (+) Transcript_37699:635-1459(+)